ncbi:1-(5-phosphoribosyl)-5-[(5-phosphoribosylamino)methylideneamino]imidazole-4-carboxamide isomerase [Reichenbachiella sp. MALMAid0571]|uniref:1-(5-phosphoribosyl)-5-[(5- phosphoribosylamino)methylideneamino]imidazole-4- carboxamide isomerase n=1 Tax=Reichenbachiella sp. MALMAid0571 TaxID=3143939 RepID=UPI0032E02187
MIRIIPAIDIIDGKCVRLTKGDYNQKKIYNEDPLEVAKEFEENGIKYLHLVDLDGAKSAGIVNWKVLEKIASNTSLTIDFGGGIKTDEDINIAFENGAAQINVGSTAIKNRPLFIKWLLKYGSDKVILSADAKNEKIAIGGWQDATETDIYDFIGSFQNVGLQYLVSTDIDKDGMLQGASLDLYKNILEKYPEMKVVASGGITELSEIDPLVEIGADGVIIGKAIYENRITLKDLRKYAN